MLRGQLMAAAQEVDGGMLAVGAPLTQIEAALKELSVDLVVANHNSPTQVVLSGRVPEIDKRSTSLFATRNIRGKKLSVAAAFHSPLVAPASRNFRPVLDEVDFDPPSMPVYANSTAAEYPAEPQAARDLLATQLARPVHFVREVEQMYADGVRTFLEVGPGAVLTGLVNSILNGSDYRAAAVDGSSGKRNGLFDLATSLVQLSASGYPIRWDQWDPKTKGTNEQGGAQRMRIPICGANYVKPRPPIPPRAAQVQSPIPAPLVPALRGKGRGEGILSSQASTPAKAAVNQPPPSDSTLSPLPAPLAPALRGEGRGEGILPQQTSASPMTSVPPIRVSSPLPPSVPATSGNSGSVARKTPHQRRQIQPVAESSHQAASHTGSQSGSSGNDSPDHRVALERIHQGCETSRLHQQFLDDSTGFVADLCTAGFRSIFRTASFHRRLDQRSPSGSRLAVELQRNDTSQKPQNHKQIADPTKSAPSAEYPPSTASSVAAILPSPPIALQTTPPNVTTVLPPPPPQQPTPEFSQPGRPM